MERINITERLENSEAIAKLQQESEKTNLTVAALLDQPDHVDEAMQRFNENAETLGKNKSAERQTLDREVSYSTIAQLGESFWLTHEQTTNLAINQQLEDLWLKPVLG